jgi:hypothetical protein
MKKYFLLFLCITFIKINTFAQNWEKIKVASWQFQISLPSNAQQVIDNDACVLVGKAEGHKFQVIVKKNEAQASENALLNESMNGFVDTQTDKIVSRKDIKVQNFVGKELNITTNKGKEIVMRTIIAKNKTYLLIVLANNLDDKNVKQFFNSFMIK